MLDSLILGASLAMDAFAVSMCKGLAVKRLKLSHILICGLYFGAFQALMPTIGFFLGKQFEKYINSFDYWIAFALLAIIGINMIKESLSKEVDECTDSFSFSAMLPLAIATSIDALTAGVSFVGASNLNVPFTIVAVGVFTFSTSAIGVKIGNVFGSKYKSKAELTGGIILVALGIKFLIEGLIENI